MHHPCTRIPHLDWHVIAGSRHRVRTKENQPTPCNPCCMQVHISAPAMMKHILTHYLPGPMLARIEFYSSDKQARCLELLPGMRVLGLSHIRPAMWDVRYPELGPIAEACRQAGWRRAHVTLPGFPTANSFPAVKPLPEQSSAQMQFLTSPEDVVLRHGRMDPAESAADSSSGNDDGDGMPTNSGSSSSQAQQQVAMEANTAAVEQQDQGQKPQQQGTRTADKTPLRILLMLRKGGKREVTNMHKLRFHLNAAFPKATISTFSGDETIPDVIRMFALANVSIGFHGAGIANALYAQHGALHVEISLQQAPNTSQVTLTNDRILLLHPGLQIAIQAVPFTRATVGSEAMGALKTVVQRHGLDPGKLIFFHRWVWVGGWMWMCRLHNY